MTYPNTSAFFTAMNTLASLDTINSATNIVKFKWAFFLLVKKESIFE
ncbi:MAG: hypothetical protein ACXACX_10215 [Candidatus Hodarchaeales archaeon]|jgi:hypothetical protein